MAKSKGVEGLDLFTFVEFRKFMYCHSEPQDKACASFKVR